jgi:nucleotide-binding universal stress UspA family protein
MNDKDQILVAYDRSDEAVKALEHTITIAAPEDEIIVLMVLPEPDSDLFSVNAEDFSIRDGHDHLESLKDKYKHHAVKLVTEVKRGNIIEEILKASENPRCRLIVLGYKGISRIGKFLLGSISGEVAKRAKNPVLIVK